MGYQVIRVEKLKSAPRILGRLRHATRDRIPENADPARVRDNTAMQAFADGSLARKDTTGRMTAAQQLQAAMARYRSLLPAKFRKDAVQVLEFVVSGSPADLAKLDRAGQDNYLNQAAGWIINRFGGEGNFVYATVHRDETTPHLSLFMVPRITNERGEVKLSAKHYIDGPKALSELQTAFHRDVSRSFGLERGREFSPARHMTIHQFYRRTVEFAREIRARQEQSRTQARAKRSSGMER